jgi:c-di-GMP-binding flagellar brake protein YcgR
MHAIHAKAPSVTDSSNSPDGRAFARVGDALLVAYTIADDIPPEFTETYDIGIGGLAMLTNADLGAGTRVEIALELRGDAQPKLRLTGAVRWSLHDTLLGKWRTGIEFLERTEEQQRGLLRYIDTIHQLRDLGVI